MKDYQVRFLDEYNKLVEKYKKLNHIIYLYNNDKLDFELNCPIELLKDQSDIMWRYINILKDRSYYEEIELDSCEEKEIWKD